jgi:uncharacterized membrane protein
MIRPVSRYDVALLLHLAGVIGYFAGIVLAAAAFMSARRLERPAEIAAVLRLARSGVLVAGIASLVLLVFGFWLADLTGHDMGEGWLSASLALFIVAAVLGGIGGQQAKRARLLATELAKNDDRPSAELADLLADRRAFALNVLAALATVAVLVLMVWRPGS